MASRLCWVKYTSYNCHWWEGGACCDFGLLHQNVAVVCTNHLAPGEGLLAVPRQVGAWFASQWGTPFPRCWPSGSFWESKTCWSILLVLVNKESILSKATVVIFLAFSKMQLFFIRMPLLVARFNTMAIILGTVSPSHRAPARLCLDRPPSRPRRSGFWYQQGERGQITMAIMLSRITPLKKQAQMILQTAWQPHGALHCLHAAARDYHIYQQPPGNHPDHIVLLG